MSPRITYFVPMRGDTYRDILTYGYEPRLRLEHYRQLAFPYINPGYRISFQSNLPGISSFSKKRLYEILFKYYYGNSFMLFFFQFVRAEDKIYST